MKRYIVTHNEIVGFHRYANAPAWCSYLKDRHRHVFVVKCEIEVSHNDRELEFNNVQEKIDAFFRLAYGTPCEFGDMSCEDIAEVLINKFGAYKVEVLEDGYGGATLTAKS